MPTNTVMQVAQVAAQSLGWQLPVGVGGAFTALAALIGWIIKFYSKQTTEQQKVLIDIVKSNTEAHAKLCGAIDANSKITEESSKRIEDLYIQSIRNSGNK